MARSLKDAKQDSVITVGDVVITVVSGEAKLHIKSKSKAKMHARKIKRLTPKPKSG